MISKIVLTSIAFTSTLLASSPIQTINIEGNLKVPTKFLQKNIQNHIGKIADQNELNAIIQDTEAYYRKHNYTLAYAQVQPQDESKGIFKIVVGKYADFNERSIGEMKRRTIEKGSINQIFFVGNEKISTYRLMKLIEPSLGKTNDQTHLDEIVKEVENYYREHRYELAYAQVKKVDEQGIVTIEIKKHPNFKALYAYQGKN
ncbi:MAG: hypothetical protein JZU62_05575 [Sulfuricurvum sp.]|uniref:POTRA domain-containing protein n=1 Tax=Sulfuricurvum sp. TaxID=2025608 RepID=UPI0025D2CB2C|nr:POTRA domain-containing protein [Sulfuricurvum sp.]MBV5321134.1 hypothetical protein [Sulfuricurvum sp.]